jgi:ABC-type multidrug transport system ATPase subunit
MPAAIEIKNLTKQYPVPLKREVVNAVDNLSLTVGEGEIFGFLGANGAGKDDNDQNPAWPDLRDSG